MRAQVVTEIPSLAPALGEIPKPEPLPGELLVRVEACGICGTDLHILAGESYRPDLPFVLGHEGVGVVTAAGSPEDAGWIGQRVTSTLFEGAGGDCDLCRAGTGPCLDGNERLCPTIRSVIGISKRNGAFAEFVAMRAGQAIPVPETLSSPDAAALVDAGATAVNTVEAITYAGPAPLVVVGAGPVGFFVAELLARDGRDLVVVEPQRGRRDAAIALGHQVVPTIEDAPATPCVIECSGSPAAIQPCLDVLLPRGMLVLAGYATVPSLDMASIARKELSIRGVRSGSNAHLRRALELAAAGEIRVPRLTLWPLEEMADALGALRAGEVEGKAVITVEA
ncbi:MAG: alcohol dehydrogenase catalytic domain-containing protein [Thermoleophilia bacterium]